MEMKDTQKHKLTYAIGNDGSLVYVDDVKPGKECACICPACHEPLIAKNKGQVRKHHFAHQSGTECEHAYETMLHLLAKKRVQKAFLKADSFVFDFEYRSYCPNEKGCKYERHGKCYSKIRKRPNLKDFYDCCEQEVVYDNIKRCSDLKLFSSIKPDREPVYIEFCVTHASEEEKLHSGNKIIECMIESEEDIDAIVENGFVEDVVDENDYDDSLPSKIRIYGFRNEDSNNKDISTEISFSRYVLYKSGKERTFLDHGICKHLRKSSQNTLYEVCFHSIDYFNINEYAKYLGYDKYHIPNCRFCKDYVSGYSGCKNYRYLQIPRYVDLDTSRARNCPCYIFNQEEHDKIMQQGCDVPYEEIR